MNDKPKELESSSPEQPAKTVSEPRRLASIWEPIKQDYAIIRTILLAALVVIVLMSIPLLFILRNFVTFDALDNYLKLTEGVRPKILHTISEELFTGYSKKFIFRSTTDNAIADNTMLFYATRNQRVTLSVDATVIEGTFQPLVLQLNGCNIGGERTDPPHLYNYELTSDIQRCSPDEPDLHTLRIAFHTPLKKPITLQVKCLVVVYQRIHEHLEGTK